MKLTSLPGSAALLEALLAIDQGKGPLAGLFDPERALTAARAPARLDVMGGFSELFGSRVLSFPLLQSAWAVVQEFPDNQVEFVSADPRGVEPPRRARYLRSWFNDSPPGQPPRFIHRETENAWSERLAAALLALLRGTGAELAKGLRVLVISSVPEAAGVASSAAIEIATLKALATHRGLTCTGIDLARFAQIAENWVAESPTGIRDPLAVTLAEPHHLLDVLCQPDKVVGLVPLPDELTILGVDSGVRQESSHETWEAIVAARMGYRILAELEGLRLWQEGGAWKLEDSRYGGYLVNLTESKRIDQHLAQLPAQISGEEFLARYQGTFEPTRVEPDQNYKVRASASHAIKEHARAKNFAELLLSPQNPDVPYQLGKLMMASHESYGACGLGSKGTDRLVHLIRMLGPLNGLYGARITGRGGGGTMAVLIRPDSEQFLTRAVERYSEETKRSGVVFSGSSPGAELAKGFRLHPSMARREAETLA